MTGWPAKCTTHKNYPLVSGECCQRLTIHRSWTMWHSTRWERGGSKDLPGWVWLPRSPSLFDWSGRMLWQVSPGEDCSSLQTSFPHGAFVYQLRDKDGQKVRSIAVPIRKLAALQSSNTSKSLFKTAAGSEQATNAFNELRRVGTGPLSPKQRGPREKHSEAKVRSAWKLAVAEIWGNR